MRARVILIAMRLLICTQTVDLADPVMGFFHRWIEELAKHCESVTVICLREGEHDLPKNVRVLSLGKERGASRLHYVLRFYSYLWHERKNYDAVFVHMNQEYVLLGGVLWRMLGKKVGMWRNHKSGSLSTYIAVWLSNDVFCTSRLSFTARFAKSHIMPVGIDTDFFSRRTFVDRKTNSILSLGRIAPVKNISTLIDAVALLRGRKISFTLDIYGDALPRDAAYMESLKRSVIKNRLDDVVTFYAGIPNAATPEIYNTHEIFVNMSPNGLFDKTIFEAAACECVVVATSSDFAADADSRLVPKEISVAALADTFEQVLKLSHAEKEKLGKDLRAVAESKHGLALLVERLMYIFNHGK